MAKKQKSAVLRIFTVVVILIALLLVVLLFLADRLVKVSIETAIARKLNVGASIESARINPFTGKITIRNLAVNNPPGFEYEHVIKLKSLYVKADVGSLLSDIIQIKHIKLDDLEIVIEQKGFTGNFSQLLKSISKSPKEQTAEAAEPAKKVHVDVLEINRINVNAKLVPISGKADTVSLKISSMRLTEIGTDGQLTVAGLIGRVFTAVAEEIFREGAGVLPQDILSSLQSGLEENIGTVVETGKEILDKGKDLGEEVLGLKGLFELKKED